MSYLAAQAILLQKAAEIERDEAIEKLDFLKSKGLTVGMMTSSDKPAPYLVYVIEYGSELCDMRAVNKLVDAELERDTLRARVAELEGLVQEGLDWEDMDNACFSAAFLDFRERCKSAIAKNQKA